MNMWGFTPRLFDHLDRLFLEFLQRSGKELKGESYIPMSVGQLVRERHATCRVLRTASEWFGVTYKEDKPVVQAKLAALVARGDYPANLWS
jgi:hypothetical protein